MPQANDRSSTETGSINEYSSSAAGKETPAVRTDKAFVFPTLSLAATSFTEKQLIDPGVPQVALAGRSNVGKSSLVNALAKRKALAKVSSAPGKTRSINYYAINDEQRYLVDLPGYGYAQCSHAERNKWAALMTHYFTHTPGLTSLFLLIDSRLPPQKADRDLALYAASLSLPVIPVLTKIDKSDKKARRACLQGWSAHFSQESFIATSAAHKKGLEELWMKILALLEQ